ncbi:MAG: helix-turn-helix transcriptional regulator, partial [Firmicutes bacterium]|nr:helix-turn-helix transcriptional regulator [Bacillota bacterium]
LSDFNLSLPMICDAIGCSVQHLSRLFRAEKDTTINEYVHSQRIARSRILLQDGSLSVAQIAAQVGYASLDTFSRNFRRHTGMSPSEYRNNMRA